MAQNRTVKQEDDYHKAECEYTIGIPFGDVPVTDKEVIATMTKAMGDMVEANLMEALKGKQAVPRTTTTEPQKPTKPSEDKADTALGWKDTVMCQACGKTVQVKKSKSTGKPWAICCGHWLHSDGSAGEPAPANMK